MRQLQLYTTLYFMDSSWTFVLMNRSRIFSNKFLLSHLHFMSWTWTVHEILFMKNAWLVLVWEFIIRRWTVHYLFTNTQTRTNQAFFMDKSSWTVLVKNMKCKWDKRILLEKILEQFIRRKVHELSKKQRKNIFFKKFMKYSWTIQGQIFMNSIRPVQELRF